MYFHAACATSTSFRLLVFWYTFPQLSECAQKYNESTYIANSKEPEMLISKQLGPDTSTKTSFLSTQKKNAESSVKQSRKRLRRRVNQKLVKPTAEESYYVDGKYALESTAWQNDMSGSSSDWERLSEFSDIDMNSPGDSSDWEF